MKNRILHMSIRQKLILVFTLIVVIMFGVEFLVSKKVNQSVHQINEVYATNVENNELKDNLDFVQQYTYEYLNTRSSESLENFYRYEQEYQNLIAKLNDKPSEDEFAMSEKVIREMSERYLETLDKTVLAKRGRNIEKYKKSYEKCCQLYQYISDYIETSNEKHFRQNSSNYQLLIEKLKRIEVVSVGVLFAWAAVSIYLIYLITGSLIGPLTQLAKTADRISAGDFEVEIPKVKSYDEVGIVTRAFDSMMKSIREYILQIQLNKEKEQKMLERQYLMENYVKDARLKYLQAQINPHFLYNSLNAGMQLAIMEGAEETSIFLDKMADFFRYNVRKMKEDATLFEEIEAVDNYIYIINVRFAGDIHFEKEIASDVENLSIPSMILQPIVENSVNHGLHEVEWERKISLKVYNEEDNLIISVRDNGIGMTQEQIESVLNKKETQEENENTNSNSQKDTTGVGMDNVKKRLELYYNSKDLLKITSEGKNKGTTVTITISNKGD